MIFVCCCSLLGYRCVVVIGSYMGHVVKIRKPICSSSEFKVGATMGYIQTYWSIRSDKILKMLNKFFIFPSVHCLTPMSEPSTIDFSTKDKRIVSSELSYLDIWKLSDSSTLAQSNMCSRPIVFLIEPRCIFNIKFTVYIFIFPHSYYCLGVIAIAI